MKKDWRLKSLITLIEKMYLFFLYSKLNYSTFHQQGKTVKNANTKLYRFWWYVFVEVYSTCNIFDQCILW
uniref:Uncharacterized protein n=1 Tax=Anguilla anguilla TaxID=7936 RepID=A0A0E9XK28_ANGAN